MNERIKELAEQALFESDFDDEQNIKITLDLFAELIVKDCDHYLNSEVERLAEYQNSLSQIDYDRRADCDLAIEKCLDNIEGLKQHFGIE